MTGTQPLQVHTRYSKSEAARSVLGGAKPHGGRQFCSRLVARAYGSVGIQLVSDQDYCTPDDLRKSLLLVELRDVIQSVSVGEMEAIATHPNPLQIMRDAQNALLAAGRKLDPKVENFNDLDRIVQEHPEWDSAIAEAYRDSGYLDIWRHELQLHPYRYDLALMESIAAPEMLADLRSYCIETIREAHSGGVRFAVNMTHYRAAQSESERETLALLIGLYETLVHNHEVRVETARFWLLRHHPADIAEYMERVVPHSELWFLIVDRVEPRLGAIARHSIQSARSTEVCSSCGDPAHDYRLENGADAMPGVPSLRLCDDCVEIRRGFGEVLHAWD